MEHSLDKILQQLQIIVVIIAYILSIKIEIFLILILELAWKKQIGFVITYWRDC